MINKDELNKALEAIVEKRNELSGIGYNDESYDDVEEELHELEDDFNEEFGDYLEDVFMDIHDELCPDSDVLLPTAYISKKYEKDGAMDDGDALYKIGKDDGVFVEVDDYDGQDTRLLVIPSPMRIWLIVNGEPKEQLWAV